MKSGCHKTCDVSHIYHKYCANFVRYFTEFLEINGSGISTCTCDNHFGLALQCDFTKLVVIDESVIIYTVRYDVEIFTGNVNRASVCQMSAVVKVHTHDGISGVTYCKLNGKVSLCSGMRLYVSIICSEQFLCSLDGKSFYYVYAIASAVVSLSGITFRIFIGQNASHGCHNRFAYPVLGSNQLDMAVLTLLFIYNGLRNFRIHILYFF